LRQAVLLVAHGAPERVEDVAEYLGCVFEGRSVPARVVEEVRSRYLAVGGGSPLLARSLLQAEALRTRLDVPVYLGMRNWHPFLQEALARIEADGVERIVALGLIPQACGSTLRPYQRAVEAVVNSLCRRVEIVWAQGYHLDPNLVDAFAEKLQPSAGVRVLFTAHSLPLAALAPGDDYERQVRGTAAAVAARAGLQDWDVAFQSQGMAGGEWLGPTVESRIDAAAEAGVREIVVQTIGFVADHVEVLYDVDIAHREYARARGISLRRVESLNASARYIDALADIAGRYL